VKNVLLKQRVLIVDDAPANINILGGALISDYNINVATNGADALRLVNSATPPDIVLLDIMMPGMDGYEVCRSIKSDQTSRNIPVIFITAKSEEEDETRGFELGAIDYITKPFSVSIVKARVRTHLELKRRGDLLEEMASIDGLTGIPNRRGFDRVLEKEWRRADRASNWLSLIMIDIDFFKAFNDKYLHLAGDDCLKAVARDLVSAPSRAGDFVARYGGEEFAAVLPDTDSRGAVTVAEKMRERIMSLDIKHYSSAVADRITISLGTASLIPGDGWGPDTLIENADKMLFEAKRNGRNRVKSVIVENAPDSA